MPGAASAGVAPVASTAAPSTAASTAARKAKRQPPKNEKAEAAAERKSVVAQTDNGTVHSVTDFQASRQKEAEDTKLVEENPEQTGENYIEAQQNLPDVVVVGGAGGGSAGTPSGVEP